VNLMNNSFKIKNSLLVGEDVFISGDLFVSGSIVQGDLFNIDGGTPTPFETVSGGNDNAN
jgi:hypothetical protein